MKLLKTAVRKAMGVAGLEIYQARGGIFICPAPRATRAKPSGSVTGKRLHLGCGNVRLEGYVNIDVVPTPATDLVANVSRLEMFADGSIDEIRLEALIEHLFRFERLAALREWHRILSHRGTLDIRWIPDFAVYAGAWLEHKPGQLSDPIELDEVYHYTHGLPMPGNAPEQVHKDIFTKESVRRELEAAGFEVVSMENTIYRDQTFATNINVIARKI